MAYMTEVVRPMNIVKAVDPYSFVNKYKQDRNDLYVCTHVENDPYTFSTIYYYALFELGRYDYDEATDPSIITDEL